MINYAIMQDDLEDLPLFTCSSLTVCVDASELLPVVCSIVVFVLPGLIEAVGKLFLLLLIDISLFVVDTLFNVLSNALELGMPSSTQS